jgi:hypothetical protein
VRLDVLIFSKVWSNLEMMRRECYHCHQWVEDNQEHDCWTTTEKNLTSDLSEELLDAWERLRETASSFGEQRIYASHKSIMFSRKACYFFVRPKKSVLEVWFFLGRTLKASLVRKTQKASKIKVAHLVHVTHRDHVEPPLTDWLREAFETSEGLSAKPDERKAKSKDPRALSSSPKGKSSKGLR